MKKNTNIKPLIALIAVFVLGYLSLSITHVWFEKKSIELDNKIKNEYARNKIGEYILNQISSVETKYYQMATVFKAKSLKPIEQNIRLELDKIEQAIDVLENGGIVKKTIKLNIVGVSESTEEISFTPKKNSLYTFEAIDLKPKINDLKKQIGTMYDIIKLKKESTLETDPKKVKKLRFKIQIFLKQIPPMFIRMKENTSRLLYDSKKNLEEIEKDIIAQKQYYKKIEYFLIFFVFLLITILGYIVVKQILNKNNELNRLSDKANEAASEAKKANDIKSQFLANMSHEIRTPLNAIIGFSDMLAQSNLPPKEKEHSSIIAKSARALLNIINDILDISKVESGKFDLVKEEFNIRDLIENLVELYSINAKQKNIRFIYDYDLDIPLYLISDETRLKQVISNLLSNAIKFTPNDKKVLFQIKLVNIENNIASIKFLIKDEGIGISQDVQRQIFEPFTQADGSISRKYGGTGLGLSICLKIVELMGSKINLISREDEGSNFFFTLDLKTSQIKHKVEKKEKVFNFAVCKLDNDEELLHKNLKNIVSSYGNIYEGDSINSANSIDVIFYFGDEHLRTKVVDIKQRFNSKIIYVGDQRKINLITKDMIDYYLDLPLYSSKVFNCIAKACKIENHVRTKTIDTEVSFDSKILVAEDNRNNQMLIKLLLTNLGADVTIAENGKVALSEYKKGYFDLIFLDINMPVMDGLSALKEIRDFEKKAKIDNIPIIALTANTIKGDREKYISEGMNDYLSKPIENQKLIKILSKYLKKEK